MEITLRPGQKASAGPLGIELLDIVRKRLESDPETGRGGEEERHLNLRLSIGNKSERVTLVQKGQEKAEFEGYSIVLLDVESFEEWARFKVEK